MMEHNIHSLVIKQPAGISQWEDMLNQYAWVLLIINRALCS